MPHYSADMNQNIHRQRTDNAPTTHQQRTDNTIPTSFALLQIIVPVCKRGVFYSMEFLINTILTQ